MSKFKVKSNLKHNGKSFKRGQEVELNDAEAELLLKDGIVTELDDNTEVEESDRPQPPVNKATREDDNADAPTKVEPGKVEQLQPGDGADAPVEAGEGAETKTEEAAPEKKEGLLGKILGKKEETKEEDNGDNL